MSRHFPVIFVNRLISGAHDRTVNSFWRMNLPFMVFDTQKLAAKCFIDLPESMAKLQNSKLIKGRQSQIFKIRLISTLRMAERGRPRVEDL